MNYLGYSNGHTALSRYLALSRSRKRLVKLRDCDVNRVLRNYASIDIVL